MENIKRLQPDLLFFSGDQVYDHRRHYAAWLRFGRDFGEVIKDFPTVSIPDDHDAGNPTFGGTTARSRLFRGIRRWIRHARRVRQGSGAGSDQPLARSLRSHSHRAWDRNLLHPPQLGADKFCHYRGPQVQDRTGRNDSQAGTASGSHSQPRIRPQVGRRPKPVFSGSVNSSFWTNGQKTGPMRT